MTTVRVAAVDLGASSGRVHVAEVSTAAIDLRQVARFANGAVPVAGRLHWDILGLYRGVLDGLAAAAAPLDSIGIDSWAVDYGLLRADGSLLGNPAHHRDPRTGPAYDDLVGRFGADGIWARTGIALQPFNTLYQLATDLAAGHLDGAASVLLVPDLLAYWLTGERRTEVTNASTTQLVGPDGAWDPELLTAAGVTPGHWGPTVGPGEVVGALAADVAADLGVDRRPPVTAVASHDTASAVLAVPATDPGFAYISCGTWSLVGVELDHPVTTPAAHRAGFTNEAGIGGSVRFLRNVMGLWLLQESMRVWARTDRSLTLAALLARAAELPTLRSCFDVDRDELLAPGDMPDRIASACAAAGTVAPVGPVETTRAIVDSLAVAYRSAVLQAETLAGRPVTTVHLVGGGVHNALLCQLTADACGLPVVAGPVEAAALGNALVQAGALGVVPTDRWELRSLLAGQVRLRTYQPDEATTARYAEAARIRRRA